MQRRDFSRTSRVEAQIQREIAGFMQMEMRDPRLAKVNITDVSVSRDLSVAKLFFAVPDDLDAKEIGVVLNKAAGFVRSALAKRLRLRFMPELRFFHDGSIVKVIEFQIC
jgi:ribosome-binding factor A